MGQNKTIWPRYCDFTPAPPAVTTSSNRLLWHAFRLFTPASACHPSVSLPYVHRLSSVHSSAIIGHLLFVHQSALAVRIPPAVSVISLGVRSYLKLRPSRIPRAA
ncbi:UNVERIFIED_CONTAM: hypothetical protein Sindi_2572700 [Sesamum indicum]